MRQLLARAADGESLLVVIGGEAGVGKTRLVEQLAATARRVAGRAGAGWRLCAAGRGGPAVRAGHRGAARPGRPAGPGRAGRGRPPRPRGAGRLLPDLAWGGEAAAGPPVASRAGQGRLFELLLEVVGRLAATARCCRVLEDLHWADRSTRDLLAYLATYLRAQPVLLVLTFRSDELPAAPAATAAARADPQPPRAAAAAPPASPAPS